MKPLCFFLFLASVLQAAPENHVPIVPAAPVDLSKCLPPPPDAWKLTKSRGENAFSEWLSTEAVREYEFQQPPAADPGKPGATPPPPKKTTIRVTDTGYWKTENAMSLNAKLPKGSKRAVFQNYPMIKTVQGEQVRCTICVKKRFVIVLVTQNQTPKEAEEWLSAINCTALEQIPDDGATKLPQPLTMTVWDELDPSQSRTYTGFFKQ